MKVAVSVLMVAACFVLVMLAVPVYVLGVWLMVTSCMKRNVVAWRLSGMMTVSATLCVGEWSVGTW